MSYMVEQTFEKIGLSPRETQVYLALLERGQSTGYEISKHLGEKRTTIYYTLEELRKKGLVLKTPHASKHYFTARHPQEVAAEAHKRANELDSLLPYLSGLIKDGERPKLTYYEGIDGFDKIIEESEPLMLGQNVDGFYMYKPTISDHQRTTFIHHLDRLGKSGATWRGITQDVPSTRQYEQELNSNFAFTFKFLPPDIYPMQSSMEAFGNYTRILSRDLGQNILIENKEVANAVRIIFNIMWNCSEFITSEKYSQT